MIMCSVGGEIKTGEGLAGFQGIALTVFALCGKADKHHRLIGRDIFAE